MDQSVGASSEDRGTTRQEAHRHLEAKQSYFSSLQVHLQNSQIYFLIFKIYFGDQTEGRKGVEFR